MNRSPQPRQGLAAAGYGQRQQQQQQPQQDHYSQDPAQGQDDQYEEGQFGQEADEEHDGQYALEGEEEHQDGQYGGEDEYQHEGEEENMAADDHRPTGDKKAINGEVKQGNPGKAGQLAKKGAAGQPAKKKGARAVKPQHAHSRFAMDPHHHKMMSTFHRIASEGLTPAHIESFVHIGSFALSHLAKQAGMTAGHESDDEEEEEQAAKQ